ncbi:hypothetical protein [Emticicia sp. C21]|uniref:hypothetical protein n=1 Tax=Emticicia sp. C21 TaxID=2302915 RepID=UPI000E345282|nr:hypothetical protein [Emticicia sp. C21]RFS16445.1 hypothetical protein D0T08_12230 [Emticicia sp. C21]
MANSPSIEGLFLFFFLFCLIKEKTQWNYGAYEEIQGRQEMEDEIEILIKCALEAFREAIRESKALGLRIKFIEYNKIIEESPNGERRVLRELEREPITYGELKKERFYTGNEEYFYSKLVQQICSK